MKRVLLIAAVLPTTLALGASASAQGEDQVAQGETLFQEQCAQCHTLEEGQNRLGPHLANIVGREAGALEDFNYSDAMQQADITWTPENIDQFIADPQSFIPGNRMPYTGMPNEEDRAAVVAFLQSVSESEGAPASDSATPPETGQDDESGGAESGSN